MDYNNTHFALAILMIIAGMLAYKLLDDIDNHRPR